MFSQTIDFGKSYFNVSKGINGGTVTPGDTLEVRASFIVRGTGFFDSCAFLKRSFTLLTFSVKQGAK